MPKEHISLDENRQAVEVLQNMLKRLSQEG
jgi:hypothetical protein